MKKINAFTFVAAIAMSVGLLASCGNKSSGGSQGGKDKEVSYTQYMKALEDVDKETFPYVICYIDGTITQAGDPEPYVTFTREPVRFVDAGRPSPRPQASSNLGDFVFSYLFRSAWNYSEEDVATYYINKKDDEHKYKVVCTETVGMDQKSELTITYNSLGFPTTIKNGAAYDVKYRVTRRMATPLKDLTITWSETDTIDSYVKVSHSEFHSIASANEAKDNPYNSGKVNGTFEKYDSDTVTTLENELLLKGTSYFYCYRYEEELGIFVFKASTVANQPNYYLYKSESLGNLMAIMEMASGEGYLERIITWNSNGLIISIVDNVINKEYVGVISQYLYNFQVTYSTDEPTITVTLLSGLGAWSDGSTSKTLTVKVGSYLGNIFPVGWQQPTAEGLSAFGSYLADTNGKLVGFGEKLYSDITLVYPFYNNGSTPAEFDISAYPGKTLKFTVEGYTDTTPILVYNLSSNSGYYFQNGQKRNLEYTVADTAGLGVNMATNVFGAKFTFSNSEGPLSDGASMVTNISLAGSGEVDDYAFKGLTGLKTVSVRGPSYSRIGAHAFEGCTALEKVYGDAIEYGEEAFKGCSSLSTSFTFYQTTTIGANAFEGCTSLLLLVPGTTEYNETYAQNRFIKNKQTYPDGWSTSWAGDAKVAHIIDMSDFKHGGSAIDVGTLVSVNSEAYFAVFVEGNKTYTVNMFVANNCEMTLSNLDTGVTIDSIDGDPEYQKTLDNVTSGEWGAYILISLKCNDVNSSEVSFRFQENA